MSMYCLFEYSASTMYKTFLTVRFLLLGYFFIIIKIIFQLSLNKINACSVKRGIALEEEYIQNKFIEEQSEVLVYIYFHNFIHVYKRE